MRKVACPVHRATGELLQKAVPCILEGGAKEQQNPDACPCVRIHVCAHGFRAWVCAFMSVPGRIPNQEEERKERGVLLEGRNAQTKGCHLLWQTLK